MENKKVCVWTRKYDYIDGAWSFEECENGKISLFMLQLSPRSLFKYCPFCGKKVEFKDDYKQ